MVADAGFTRCSRHASGSARRGDTYPSGRPKVIVVLAPVVDDATHVAEICGSVLRRARYTDMAAEARDVGALHRLRG